MPGGRLIADTMAVAAIGAAGIPTVLVPQQPYDQRASIIAPAPGVFISHKPFTLTSQGYAVPSGIEVWYDIPADEGLWAIAAAGVVQVSRLICPKLQTDNTVAHLLIEYLKSIGVKEIAKPKSGGVIKKPSEFEQFDPFGAQKKK
jgi:hypothetical protein